MASSAKSTNMVEQRLRESDANSQMFISYHATESNLVQKGQDSNTEEKGSFTLRSGDTIADVAVREAGKSEVCMLNARPHYLRSLSVCPMLSP